MVDSALPQPVTVDAAGAALIGALLSLTPAQVAAVRNATPGRSRGRMQHGPSADFGDGDDDDDLCVD